MNLVFSFNSGWPHTPRLFFPPHFTEVFKRTQIVRWIIAPFTGFPQQLQQEQRLSPGLELTSGPPADCTRFMFLQIIHPGGRVLLVGMEKKAWGVFVTRLFSNCSCSALLRQQHPGRSFKHLPGWTGDLATPQYWLVMNRHSWECMQMTQGIVMDCVTHKHPCTRISIAKMLRKKPTLWRILERVGGLKEGRNLVELQENENGSRSSCHKMYHGHTSEGLHVDGSLDVSDHTVSWHSMFRCTKRCNKMIHSQRFTFITSFLNGKSKVKIQYTRSNLHQCGFFFSFFKEILT